MKYLIAILGVFALCNGVFSLGTFSGSTSCNRISCFRRNRCPSASGMMADMKEEGMECKMCVASMCGPYDANNASLIAECLMEARAECMSCSGTDMDRMQMRNCNTCFRICTVPGSTSSTRDRESITRQEMLRAQRSQCQNQCERSEYCMTEDQMMNRTAERQMMCKSCVRNICGEFEQADLVNRTLSRCVYRAQIEGCRQPCLTGNDLDQETKRNCSMCVNNCVRQAQKSPCLRMCEVDGGCPTDEQKTMERQDRLQMCKTCVRSVCGEFEFADLLTQPGLWMCVRNAQSQNCTMSCSTSYMSSFEEDCMSCVEECEGEAEMEEVMEEVMEETGDGTVVVETSEIMATFEEADVDTEN